MTVLEVTQTLQLFTLFLSTTKCIRRGELLLLASLFDYTIILKEEYTRNKSILRFLSETDFLKTDLPDFTEIVFWYSKHLRENGDWQFTIFLDEVIIETACD